MTPFEEKVWAATYAAVFNQEFRKGDLETEYDYFAARAARIALYAVRGLRSLPQKPDRQRRRRL